MRAYQRWEIVCAALALGWGLLLLMVVYLRPVVLSTAANPYALTIQPGFSAQAVPYVVAVGLPALGVVVGAAMVAVAPGRAWRLLLALATAALVLETGIAAASFGPGAGAARAAGAVRLGAGVAAAPAPRGGVGVYRMGGLPGDLLAQFSRGSIGACRPPALMSWASGGALRQASRRR